MTFPATGLLILFCLWWLDALIWNQLALHSKRFMAGGLTGGS